MPSPPPPPDNRRRIGIAALIWGVSIFLSRIIGLVREMVISRVLGGDAEADVYFTAFVIPDFLNYLLAGGALSIVFIPIFAGYLAREDEPGAWRAFSTIATPLGIALVGLTALLWFAMPALAPVVAPGFDAGQHAQLVALTRIVLPAQIFHLLGGLLSASLQARDRHALPALAPLLYTGSVVAFGLALGPSIGAFGFAWGVLVGSVLGPFGLPLYGCLRTGMHFRPVLAWTADLRSYLWQSLPIMLGWSIVVLDDWILRIQGSLLGDSAIATLQYAKTLMKVPMGTFGLATGVATFPTLSRLIAQGDEAGAYGTLAAALRRMLVLAFAAQVALTVAGTEIATVIYGGKLPHEQHVAIGTTLALMSVGLWAWAAQTVVGRGFYARGNTWLPTLVGTVLAALAYPLYMALARSYGTSGLAAAGALSMTVYVVVLVLLLRRTYGTSADGYGAYVVRIVPSIALGIAAGWGLGALLPEAPLFGGTDASLAVYALTFLRGAVLALAGMTVYGVVARVLGLAEVTEVTRLVMRKLSRSPRRPRGNPAP